jgi:hypothetical protein
MKLSLTGTGAKTSLRRIAVAIASVVALLALGVPALSAPPTAAAATCETCVDDGGGALGGDGSAGGGGGGGPVLGGGPQWVVLGSAYDTVWQWPVLEVACLANGGSDLDFFPDPSMFGLMGTFLCWGWR